MIFGIEIDKFMYFVALGLSLMLLVFSALSGADFDLDFDFDAPDGVEVGGAGLPKLLIFNPIALLTFFGSFGAIGLIARGAGASQLISVIIALVGGFAIAMLVYRLIVEVLFKRQGSSAYVLNELIGTIATVNVPIPATGMGTIAYEIGGRRETLAARTAGEQTVQRGVEVVIVEMERNVATVQVLE